MIKCIGLSICAVITRNASVKQGKDNQEFVSFGISYPVSGRNGEAKNLDISVSVNGGKDTASVYSTGRRVNVTGTLSIVKRNGKIYFNLRADDKGIVLVKSTEADKLEGTMSFRGKIGKKGVEDKTDKKGEPFKVFSAFSTDKDGDKPEFTWVRFLYFNPKEGEDFLQADTYIEASGDLQLEIFKEEVALACRLAEVKPWILEKN